MCLVGCFLSLERRSQAMSAVRNLFVILGTITLVTGFKTDSYIAAVVEFAGTSDIVENARRISEFVKEAKQQNAEIVVFPEYGVVGFDDITDKMVTRVPSPPLHISPCDTPGYSTALKMISCAARWNKIYVVANVAEIAFCLPKMNCTYNTNVAFDRRGAVIARYRKMHLFAEPEQTAPFIPEMVVFETDFGVRFGTFICFDILFEKPAIPLVREYGVTDVVFPNAWVNELPFRTAIETHAAWAYEHDVNLLSACYNSPSTGNTGSGIYLGRGGVANATIQDTLTSAMLIATVPKKPRRHIKQLAFMQLPENYQNLNEAEESEGKTVVDAKVEKPGLRILPGDFVFQHPSYLLKKSSGHETRCYHDFCCHFEYSMDDGVFYRLIVVKAVASFYGFGTGGYQVCGVVACATESVDSCYSRNPGNGTIHKLSIRGKFEALHASAAPTSVTSRLLPVPAESFSFNKNCLLSECDVKMSLTKPVGGVVAFGIVGRLFRLDGHEETKSDSVE